MPIKFRCPNGHALQARDDKAGKQMRCPACKQIVTVPQPAASAKPVVGQQSSTAAKPKNESRHSTASKPVLPANKAKKKPTPRPAPPSSQPKSAAGSKQEQHQPTRHRPPPLPKQPTAGPTEPKPKGPPPLKQKHPDQKALAKVDQRTKSAAMKTDSAPRQEAGADGSKPKPAEAPSTKPTIPSRPVAVETKAEVPAAQPQPATGPSVAEAWSVAPPPVQLPARGIRKWFRFEPGARGYLPDRGKVTSVRWLALALAAIAVIGAMPARSYYYFAGAPAWAQVILVIAVVQLLYIFWMASLPDWSTVWVTMIVFAVTSAVYGFALAVTLLTPVGQGLPLNLEQVHRIAPAWCGAMVLFTFLGAFLCGRYSFKWYKTYVLTSRE